MSSRSSQPLEAVKRSPSTAPGQYTLPDRIKGDIPIDLDIGRAGKRFLFISRDQRSYTHAIHKYPAKFFPELPRWIVQRFSQPGELALDPFMGSGTTAIAAQEAGRNWIGYEISPDYIEVASKRLGLPPGQYDPGSPTATQPDSNRDAE